MQPNNVALVGKLSDNLMLSGGAKGADTIWGEYATKAGHQVIHWSFDGHKSHAPENQTVKLDIETLKEADIRLEMAKQSLGRNIPYNKPWIVNLLRRNWFQVQYAESVFAVGTFADDAPIAGIEINRQRKNKLGINGGTAWAIQMYVDRWQEAREKDPLSNPNCRITFFDQNKYEIFVYDPVSATWNPMIRAHPQQHKTPEGIYAAIGTRDLNENGKEFIRRSFWQVP